MVVDTITNLLESVDGAKHLTFLAEIHLGYAREAESNRLLRIGLSPD